MSKSCAENRSSTFLGGAGVEKILVFGVPLSDWDNGVRIILIQLYFIMNVNIQAMYMLIVKCSPLHWMHLHLESQGLSPVSYYHV